MASNYPLKLTRRRHEPLIAVRMDYCVSDCGEVLKKTPVDGHIARPDSANLVDILFVAENATIP